MGPVRYGLTLLLKPARREKNINNSYFEQYIRYVVKRLDAWSKSQGAIELTVAYWLKASRTAMKAFCQFSCTAIFLFDLIDD